MKVSKLGVIIGILAMVSLLAAPMTVFAADNDSGVTEVKGNPTSTIEITSPSNMTTYTLDIGSNSDSSTLNVKSNIDWTCTAKDADTSNTNGTMTSWNGSAYNTSLQLANQMHVKCTAESTDVTLPTEATIASGTGAGQSGDERLSSDNYRIIVTLSASATV